MHPIKRCPPRTGHTVDDCNDARDPRNVPMGDGHRAIPVAVTGRREPRLSRVVKSIIITAAAIVFLTPQTPFAQPFKETRRLTSNNIIALAGSGDTLWLATEQGLYYSTSVKSVDTNGDLPGFEYSRNGYEVKGLEFGGGTAAAIFYKYNDNEMRFWQFNHATGNQREKSFRFNGKARDENGDFNPTGGMAYAHGYFWAAFGHGGLVKYDPNANAALAIRPGDDEESPPEGLDSLSNPLNGSDSAKVVKELGVIRGDDGSDSLIWVATLSTVWTYDPVNRKWGALDMKPADRVYGVLDSMESSNGFSRYFYEASDNPNAFPEINAMLFLPDADNDSTGTLAIGTTTGLYICQSAEPLAGRYGAFTLSRYVREVKAGEAYALPGVIRGGWTDSRYEKCVFVYKLKKDGDVTIRVYDYNMSLVKTVVKGRRRGSKTERSTKPDEDVWDGKNESGRSASPGVYYFKITSTGGDRFHGKVILAK